MKIIIEINEPKSFEDTRLTEHHDRLMNDDFEVVPYDRKLFELALHDEINSWLEDLRVDIKKISFK